MKQETPEEDFIFYNCIESKEYIINFDDTPCNILIGKTKKNVIISSLCFTTNLNKMEFGLAINKEFESIDELYDYIINIFDKKNAKIKINEKREIILNLLLLNGKEIQINNKNGN